MPQREVQAAVIRAQAGIAEGRTLVRDHNSPQDVVIQNDQIVDLAEGNVFYTLAACEVQPRRHCEEPPKLAFFVDDRPEIAIRAEQTGKTIRELFGIALNAKLVRDTEGPADETIEQNDSANFQDGPVFYTRIQPALLSITVNAQVFTEQDGVKHSMTGQEIAALVYPQIPRETRVWLVSDGNREIGLDEKIEIRGCEVFDVVRKKVDGGYEASRVERELGALRAGGQVVTAVTNPVAAVVYHDLRTRPGNAVPKTDVLVTIPGGYPAQMLDGAYLPDGSPLIGRVKGSPQGHCVTALSRVWRQISYHPHNGGGGPQWNPAVHGLHTYIGEIVSWLYDAN